MRNSLLALVFLFCGVANAESVAFAKRPFNISQDNRDLVVESSKLTLLTEQTVQAYRRPASMTFGFFGGSVALKNQNVSMGETVTGYNFSDSVPAVGIDVKKDLYRQWLGLGFQLEYETFRNKIGELHMIPATGYLFGRTRGYTKLNFKCVGEVGYTAGYVRQLGTTGRTGGLGGNSGFLQGGVEVPLNTRDQWSLGLFYSNRFANGGEFDFSGQTLKLQGSITL